jgi:hypothetical protein
MASGMIGSAFRNNRNGVILDSEGELCGSDNLDDTRRADKESELGSVLDHRMLIGRLCQLWAGANSFSGKLRRAPRLRAEHGDLWRRDSYRTY